MVDVQPQQFLRQAVAIYFNVKFFPDLQPGLLRFFQQVCEFAQPPGFFDCCFQRIANIYVVGAVKGCGFNEGERALVIGLGSDHSDGPAIFRLVMIFNGSGFLVDLCTDLCGSSNVNARSGSFDFHILYIVFGAFTDLFQVLLVQAAVAGHPVVDMIPVEFRLDFYIAGVILRFHLVSDAGQVRIGHAGKSSAVDEGFAPLFIPDHQPAAKKSLVQVQAPADGNDLHIFRAEPFASVDAKTYRQPVDGIDKILVFDHAITDL